MADTSGGHASQVIRQMVGPVMTAQNVTEDLRKTFRPPPEHHRLPERVEPGWKLWKRRELRSPKAWREPDLP